MAETGLSMEDKERLAAEKLSEKRKKLGLE